MALFEEMSVIEKEELIVSLATLICADAKVEMTVSHYAYYLLCRRKTSTSSSRNLVTRLLLTGLPSSLLPAKVRISSISSLPLVDHFSNV